MRLSWVTFRGPSQAALLSGFYVRPEEGLMCPNACLIFPATPIGIRSEFTFAYKPCPESASCPQSQGHKKQRHETVKLQSL